mmetsp:Transcript_57551/g.122105  ORF Transcript_57551/g.122105 Transcript_57551/m.122105 type:complete len:92 (-) Transcript_57551:604-879(-)
MPSFVMAAKVFRTNLWAFAFGEVVEATVSLAIEANRSSLYMDSKVNKNGGGIVSDTPIRSMQSSVAEEYEDPEECCSRASISNNRFSRASR